MTKIKPCPFCGGEARLIEFEQLFNEIYPERSFTVRCYGCSCDINDYESGPAAIAAWNTRYERPDCASANKDPDGKCLGFSPSESDDEPIEQCKLCQKKYHV